MNTIFENQCKAVNDCPYIGSEIGAPCGILPPLPDARTQDEKHEACERILAAKVLNMTGL